MYAIEIGHNIEMAHRLSSPSSPEKCVSIHGHSWWVTVRIASPALDEEGMLIEFGRFKRAWRGWLDDHLDHHLVLRRGDPIADAIVSVQPDARIFLVDGNPTTELLARLLFRQAEATLADLEPAVAARVVHVHLRETLVNAASWDGGGEAH
ncbi:MAG: 6-carboxytetrahydropterin synthase [Deltaproteobacteria bacterium]|nr:MAG: 6-carboxytetrahydropterin synthase [Deltaproteobacteria bacterium]